MLNRLYQPSRENLFRPSIQKPLKYLTLLFLTYSAVCATQLEKKETNNPKKTLLQEPISIEVTHCCWISMKENYFKSGIFAEKITNSDDTPYFLKDVEIKKESFYQDFDILTLKKNNKNHSLKIIHSKKATPKIPNFNNKPVCSIHVSATKNNSSYYRIPLSIESIIATGIHFITTDNSNKKTKNVCDLALFMKTPQGVSFCFPENTTKKMDLKLSNFFSKNLIDILNTRVILELIKNNGNKNIPLLKGISTYLEWSRKNYELATNKNRAKKKI